MGADGEDLGAKAVLAPVAMTIAVNRRIAAIPHLEGFLEGHSGAVIGWGRKRSGRNARLVAALLRREWLLLEDGFLRSVPREGPLLSLILDDLGVYYDARHPSRLEATVAGGVSAEQASRAAALRAAWLAARLSKYNHNPDYAGDLPARYVLVVDQCYGDLAIHHGLASAASFAIMLAAARFENPGATIIVKAHPEALTGGQRGYLVDQHAQPDDALVIAEACHPIRLIDGAEKVYTVTSLIGFEALLRGKPVRCFGMPFYAGWGLTDDALDAPARRGAASLDALTYAAFIACARYVDPDSGAPWSAEEAIAYAAAARRAQISGVAG